MAIQNILDKISRIESKEPSKWFEQAKQRVEDKNWQKRSQAIAMHILDRLEELGWSQKFFAEKLDVTAQHVSNIVKGRENFTLQTIDKLENILGVSLISVNEKTSNKQIRYTHSEKYPIINKRATKHLIIDHKASKAEYQYINLELFRSEKRDQSKSA